MSDYDIEERVERIETLLACLAVRGDNIVTVGPSAETARHLITEIRRELYEAATTTTAGGDG